MAEGGDDHDLQALAERIAAVALRDEVTEARARLAELLVLAVPLLIGLGFGARARFANYYADREDLGGDFLP